MAREFRRTAKAMSDLFKTGGKLAVDNEIYEHKKRTEKILEQSYERTMNTFGNRLLRGFKTYTRYRKKEVEPVSELSWEELRNNWIMETAPETAKAIGDTTFNAVSNIISQGVQENLSSVDIADMITAQMGGAYSEIRANTVARTETHSASQSATNEMAKTLTIKVNKQWISAEDERVRTTSDGAQFDHRNADGETVELDKMFKNTGQDMEYPGWKGGSVANFVNCRCVMIMIEEKEDNDN